MTRLEVRNSMEARDIPPLTREEIDRAAERELAAFVGLLESLEGDEWERPTACDLWNVRDVVGHQGGHVQAGMGLRGMFSQFSPRLSKPYKKRGMNTLDAMNQAQVDLRRDWPTERLVAEIREGTPRAMVAPAALHVGAAPEEHSS